MHRQRVKLTADLTLYRPGLVPGIFGWTSPGSPAKWGVVVQYDNGSVLDTLWKSLEVQEAETKQEEIKSLQAAFEAAAVALLIAGESSNQLRAQVTKLAKTVKTAKSKLVRAEFI